MNDDSCGIPLKPSKSDMDTLLEILSRFLLLNMNPSNAECAFLDRVLGLKSGHCLTYYKQAGKTVYGYHP